MGRLGELFHEGRMAKGLTRTQVEQATHIRERILGALEDGDYSQLPPPAFLRGLARSYGAYLGLDPTEVNALLDEEIGPPDHAEVKPAVEEVQSPGAITGSMLALVLGLLCVAGLGWYLVTQYRALAAAISPAPTTTVQQAPVPTKARAPETPAASPTMIQVAVVLSTSTATGTPTATSIPSPPASPTMTPTVTGTPTPEYGVVIEARFTKRCWVQVKVDGEVVASETIPPGETRVWRAKDSVWMHAGQPDGVEITFNGKNLGILSTSGGTVKVEWTRP